MAGRKRRPKRGSQRWEWGREVESLDGDYFPGEEIIARTKRYSSDTPVMPILAVIGALIVAAGVYAYIKNNPPASPVG